MNRTLTQAVLGAIIGTTGVVLAAGCSKPAEPPKTETPPAAPAKPALVSGIDTQYYDDTVRAQDDFYRHQNGKWLDTFEIPADKARYGSFNKIADDADVQLRGIIEDAAKSTGGDADAQKIGDLYNSFMDEARIEELGLKPLDADFAKIAALKDKKEIPALIAYFNTIGVDVPYQPYVHQDAKDPTKYVVDLGQSGLGLPDRDYYLKADDAKLKDALTKYQAHIEKMATIAGDKDAAKIAKDIVGLETALAKVQWTKVENRDPVKTYNVKKIADLGKLAPGYDWAAWVKAAGVDGKLDSVIVSQPSYLTGFAKLIASTPLPVWKEYFEWQLLHNAAPTLPKAYVDENFAFYGTTLRGIPENRPRWKRGVAAVESSIGEGVGKLYVAKYFPPENKARMEALVKNLLTAYSQSIDTLDWMGDDTKKKAHEKLAKFTPKIGYPNKWRDYSALEIKKDDLYGNLTRATVFEYNRNIDKLGKPIDRDEWGMTPQTVNAYYNPELNEIVFPAAILQPPFFNVAADDAVNYGGIGGVIGHEISHGFDDQGSQYDGDGKLLDAPGWFTAEDLANFKKKTAALVAQYNAFDVIPGYKINGELTLGENIADNSGLAIAYKAYKLSLAGKPSETIDGMTGEQRLYAGWAQVWRGKSRDPEAIRLVKVDPHSPANARGLLPLKNQPGFYEAYDVKEGDKMFLAPDQRVIMW